MLQMSEVTNHLTGSILVEGEGEGEVGRLCSVSLKVCLLFSRGVGANLLIENITKSGSGQTEKGSLERTVLSCQPDSRPLEVISTPISQFEQDYPIKC